MPFTFSHPAVTLPLVNKRWKYISATALIAGSIAPDFESFIGLGADKQYSHTWPGVFWFDLPIALLLSLVFHIVVKQPLIDSLPSKLAGKFEVLRNLNWVEYANANYIAVFSSCILGIVSHMLWDAFTHLNLVYPDAITSKIMWQGHRVYIILQYVSSLIGLIAIAFYLKAIPYVKVAKRNREKYKFWLFFLMVAVVIETFVFTTIAEEAWMLDKIYLINVTISSLMYALILVSFFSKYIFPNLPGIRRNV